MDTVVVISVKLCVMIVRTELYVFIPLSVALSLFQGRSSVKNLKLKVVYLGNTLKKKNQARALPDC